MCDMTRVIHRLALTLMNLQRVISYAAVPLSLKEHFFISLIAQCFSFKALLSFSEYDAGISFCVPAVTCVYWTWNGVAAEKPHTKHLRRQKVLTFSIFKPIHNFTYLTLIKGFICLKVTTHGTHNATTGVKTMCVVLPPSPLCFLCSIIRLLHFIGFHNKVVVVKLILL